ncbi:MAG: DUF2298 domain-containing protein [Ardenticatenaceae bacterium]|nr:DUF2298 domain-containing protein [Ardenticatenaceae bacterium]
MIAFFTWYLLITLFGLAAAPLAWSWLRWLPDRGWGLSRALGWLLAGFLIWFLGSLGFARVDRGSGIAGLLVVAALSAVVVSRWGGGWGTLGAWLRRHRALVLAEEIVFLAAFALWTFYRAHDNAIAATEKPMEFAFLNAIVAGGAIPPPDPWLSGFAISYYYFGYVLMGVLTTLSGVATAVAFNLGIALLFALTTTGAYSLAYNLIVSPRRLNLATQDASGRSATDHSAGSIQPSKLLLALLGPLLLVGVSNLTGLAEIANANGIGSPAFYRWLDVKEFPAGQRAQGWYPDTNWWWWRASRTVHDRVPFTDVDVEVIDEFPFFSFLLGDMHPHVLALPFVLLALGLALNLLRGAPRASPTSAAPRWYGLVLPAWERDPAWGVLSLVLTAIVVGGLGFLNSWDFPTYSLIFLAAWAIGLVLRRGRLDRTTLADLVAAGLTVLVLGIGLYLPFYLGFRSQAGGLALVSFFTKAKWQQYLLMFGLFFAVVVPLLLVQLPVAIRMWRERGLGWAEILAVAVALVLLGAGLFFRWWTVALLGLVLGLALLLLEHWLRVGLGAGPVAPEVGAEESPRRTRPLIAGGSGAEPPVSASLPDPNLLFALLLVAVGVLLTLGTEFVFIKDIFGSRMNTVFKLYYQAWTLFAVASVFGAAYLWRRLAPAARLAWGAPFALLLVGSLLYPVAATLSKADHFRSPANLDGMAWYAAIWPDDYAAIQWLKANVPGQPTILEATGDQYSQAGSISMATGFPTVLGWGGHELQWRGTYDEPGRRQPDIETIYRTTNPDEARALLDTYGVQYVYIGQVERCQGPVFRNNQPCAGGLTPPQIEKFRQFMTPVFERGQVIIFGR